MSNKIKDAKALLDLWEKLSEESRFSLAILYSNSSLFEPTIEGLSSYIAYKSVAKEERLEYASYSSSLNPIFFGLTEEEIDFVESNLPPYPILIQEIIKRREIDEKKLEVFRKPLPKNPFERMKLIKERNKILKELGLISDEWEKIKEKQSKKIWEENVKKLFLFFYFLTSLKVYLFSQNPLLLSLYLLSFPIPYNLLKYLSFKIPEKRTKEYLSKALYLYFFLRSPTSAIISFLEFGLGASLISKYLEKTWPYLSRFLEKFLYETQIYLSGIKKEKFDEKDIRKKLYNIKPNSKNIPKRIIEKYREKVDNGLIEIENPEETLFNPFALSYWRREVVAIPEGRDLKIINREYVKKIAQKEGMFFEEFIERRLKKMPFEYLSYGIYDGKLAYVRDIIGILPCQLSNALAYKEGYVTMLAMKSDEIITQKILSYPKSYDNFFA